jgi:hypothetical protein
MLILHSDKLLLLVSKTIQNVQSAVFCILKKVVNETGSYISPENIDYTTTCAKDFKRFVTLA